jgi:pimeloyl-ACP methyl ester carboxylesterase
MRTVPSTPRTSRRLRTTAAITLLLLGLTRCTDRPDETTAPQSPETSPEPFEALLFESTCTDGTLTSGLPYQVCVRPGLWNGDLLVFLPGYTDPASIPNTPTGDIGGISVPDLITGLGYAWATLGFEPGMAVPDVWIDRDVLGLVEAARAVLPRAIGRVLISGGSQGGLLTTEAVERHPEVFAGGLAGCGPIGSYRKQLAYVGDFRVVFDYYFDPVIKSPNWPVWTQSPPTNGTVDRSFWDATAQAAVASAIQAYPGRTANLLNVTRAPIDPANPGPTTQQTVRELLRYSFVGTNDAIAKLLDVPFGNIGRTYSGSTNDNALNRGVERFTFTASETALQNLETTGSLTRPLVTIHTTGDHHVPIWQQSLYRTKTSRSFRTFLLHTPITVSRYGHCTFTAEEVLGAFALLILKVTGQELTLTQHALTEPHSRAEFLRAARTFGASPQVVTR